MTEIEEWWEEQHNKNNLLFLTGTLLESVEYNHNLRHRIESNTKVLNVGSGNVSIELGLYERGCEIYSLDISKSALDKVRSLIHNAKVYTTKEYNKIPNHYFDVIIHNFVAQHMNNTDLVTQLEALILKLNNGFISLQYFESDVLNQRNLTDEKMGGYPRTFDELKLLVNEAGGKIVMWFCPPDWETSRIVRIVKL